MATCATVKTPEVMVTNELTPMQELDRVRNAVCLLRSSTSKSWNATGFYANMKLKNENNILDVHCIMTNYHVFCQMIQHDDPVVAVFHHESTEKKTDEIRLVPFALLAHSKEEELDYVLIGIDKSKMQSIGVKPILADISQLPIVKKHDKVFIIQHPEGMTKHFSQDRVKRVKKPFLEYNADTLGGSSGSPVFLVKESKIFLVALHSAGVKGKTSNWNRGVLFSEILNHLLTGKGVSGTEDLFKERLKRWKDVKIRYAVMGDSGVGKSAFINAIRGIGDDDIDAAKVDVTEEATEPKEYVHPENPNISFVHLPGIGARNYPDLSTYLEKVGLKKYDTFLIFTATRFTQNDLQLAEKVKSIGKSFFLIRTKIDVDLTPKKGKARVDVEATLRKIRNNCMDNVKGLISSEKEVFLISNYDKDKWDFDRLIEAISELPALEKQDQTTFLTDDEYLSDLKAHIDENGVSNIQDFLSKKLEGWKDVKIRVGVTGDSGTGKSAFINAIRGLNDDQYDKGAATVGETETTTEPKEYQHPDNPKIIFVDLPGIGTPNYPDLPTYCEKVSLEDYDTFLIFTATRFTKNDLDLAKKVKGIGKSFFLIRTKIDVDLTPKKGKAPIDEDKILRKIKSKCLKNVEGLISDESEIFLIGNYDKDKWDFDRLINAIGDKLHTYQKECLTLSLSNVTRECLKRKARFLKVQAIVVALASAATGKIPIPGVQGAINDVLIGSTLLLYQNKFGLHNMSEGLSLSSEGHKDRIEHFLSAIASNSSIVGFERISKSYPSIGKAIESILSFTLTLRFLSLKIDDFEKAALAAWDNATKQSIQDSSQTSTNSDSSTQ